ncbi:multicopper oxidase family protein [Ferroacidibacillus organovorans]|uniref:Copper oxidase n=1 Tax=Ferroacidibacillus organovorans TaxID=1765683 RepID=A0A117SXW4_9BACL|nr:copper oxidase [Ferroacidibacillus organovorans]KUO95915.1 copper oxidase [Ferroacidibacillus organovorans]
MHSLRLGTTKLVAPNIGFLPYQIYHGIKHFHLIAEPVQQALTNGVTIKAWGYNGSTPGPVMVVSQGDRIQVAFTNRLLEETSIHWHGLIVPNTVDGVPGIGAGPVVKPGETYVYDFVIRQAGTFMYHAHTMDAQQEMMGLAGMIVSLPERQTVNREYIILLQEWAVKMGSDMGMSGMGQTSMAPKSDMQSPMEKTTEQKPSGKAFDIDPMSMDYNYFTMNGKSFPDTTPLRVRYGEKVRIRLGNLSMDSHPMHLHGHEFQVAAGDGSTIPIPWFKNTINVAPGETWDIEFQANNPGIWAFHCHKPHHTTNDHMRDMGGMFTTLKYSR